MNGSPVTVDALVDRVMVDPFGFLERLLQEALDQLARDGTLEVDGDHPPEQLVATAIGRHLARVITAETTTSEPLPVDHRHDSPIDVAVVDDYERLVERNGELAAAVGACDCWGQQADCPICDGEGGPGWVRPDKQLFTAYVYPAVRVVARRSRPPTDPTEPPERGWRES